MPKLPGFLLGHGELGAGGGGGNTVGDPAQFSAVRLPNKYVVITPMGCNCKLSDFYPLWIKF